MIPRSPLAPTGRSRCFWRIVGVLCALSVLPLAWAAGAAKEPVVKTVEWLKTNPWGGPGKVALYRGQVDEAGVVVNVPAASVFTPSAVVVTAGDPARPLELFVKNEYSTQWDRSVQTDARGQAEVRYRTEGGAVVMLRSPRGRQPFQLFILQGAEVPVQKKMAPPFVDRKAFEEAERAGRPAAPGPAPGGAPPVLWVIAGLLAALLVVAVVFLFRRKRA